MTLEIYRYYIYIYICGWTFLLFLFHYLRSFRFYFFFYCVVFLFSFWWVAENQNVQHTHTAHSWKRHAVVINHICIYENSRPGTTTTITTVPPRKHCFRLCSCILKVTGSVGVVMAVRRVELGRRRSEVGHHTNGTGDGVMMVRSGRGLVANEILGIVEGADDDEVANEWWRCQPVSGLPSCEHWAVCPTIVVLSALLLLRVFFFFYYYHYYIMDTTIIYDYPYKST